MPLPDHVRGVAGLAEPLGQSVHVWRQAAGLAGSDDGVLEARVDLISAGNKTDWRLTAGPATRLLSLRARGCLIDNQITQSSHLVWTGAASDSDSCSGFTSATWIRCFRIDEVSSYLLVIITTCWKQYRSAFLWQSDNQRDKIRLKKVRLSTAANQLVIWEIIVMIRKLFSAKNASKMWQIAIFLCLTSVNWNLWIQKTAESQQ